MAVQLSVNVRNARLDAIETTIGTAAHLRIYDLTAGAPANCAAAITGDLIADLTLPSDWMAAASNGAKALAGSWTATADPTTSPATADFFRVYDSAGTTCHLQGTVTATGGGGDLTLDNTSIADGQTVTITGFTLTDGNA